MKFLRTYIFTLAAMLSLAAQGITVNTTPGQLAQAVGEGAAEFQQLKIVGSIDASDCSFIERSMSALTALDLSECTIVAYSGAPINGVRYFRAAEVPAAAFAGSPIKSLQLPLQPGLIIGDMAFSGTKLESLVIPSNVARIGFGAFASCDALASVKFLGNPKCDGYTFRDCRELETVDLGTAVTVSDGQFAGCDKLYSVSNTSKLQAIESRAFFNCVNLESFLFANSITKIGDAAFMHTSLDRADLAATKLKALGAWAFAQNHNLASVSLPESLSEMGQASFFECSSLKDINVPAACSTVPDCFLKDASALDTALYIGEATSSIGRLALKGASSVQSIYLPAALEHISDGAMSGMTSLHKIDLSSRPTPPTVDGNPWEGITKSNVMLVVQKECEDVYKSEPSWADFAINNDVTAVETISPSNEAELSAYSRGGIIYVSAANATIESVEVFGIDGSLLVSARPDAETASIAINSTSPFVILRTRLTDGTVKNLKINVQ